MFQSKKKEDRKDLLGHLQELNKRGLGFWLRHILVDIMIVSFVGAVWIVILRLGTNFELPTDDLGDLSALLFGAASVSLFVVSFLLATIALLGWTEVKSTIRERVDSQIETHSKRMGDEIRGRFFVVASAVTSIASRDENTYEVERKDLLARAITYSRRSLQYSNEDHDHFWGAKNNLAFTLAQSGDPIDRDEALVLADEIYRNWQRERKVTHLLTYCRTILAYGDDDGLKEDVRQALVRVARGELGEETHKKEANAYLASFFPAQQGTGSGT